MKTLRMATVVLLFSTVCVSLVVAQAEAEPQYEPFTFAVFGDTRPGDRDFSPVLQAMMTEIGHLDISFAIGTGDYIEGSSNQSTVRKQWDGFFTAMQPLQADRTIPVALTTGNHDILGVRRNAEIFCEFFNKLYYSFDHRGCHFVLLDSETTGSEGRISGTQLKWLKQDLEAAKDAKFTFVALHRPLFPVDGHIGSSMDAYPEERDALHALFVQSGVDAVFLGHEHLYNHQERDGIHYFITGGGGAPLYAKPENGGFHHYLLVSVGDDEFTVDVKRVTPSAEEHSR
ncbi:MAG: hypothetical protein GF393_07870 [Armatimonadia bacterium]|nr:hypothetical protein [Armatimonadia bacterium]